MNEIPIENLLKDNIRSLRRQMEWSQEKLAEKAGISAPYITQIELGKRMPSLDVIGDIATALGVEYHVLFTKNAVEIVQNNKDIPLHKLETNIITAVSKTIHEEFASTLAVASAG